LSLHTRSPPFVLASPVPLETSLERERALVRRAVARHVAASPHSERHGTRNRAFARRATRCLTMEPRREGWKALAPPVRRPGEPKKGGPMRCVMSRPTRLMYPPAPPGSTGRPEKTCFLGESHRAPRGHAP